jgi:hypothetical protein
MTRKIKIGKPGRSGIVYLSWWCIVKTRGRCDENIRSRRGKQGCNSSNPEKYGIDQNFPSD